MAWDKTWRDLLDILTASDMNDMIAVIKGHKSRHATGGADALSASDIGAISPSDFDTDVTLAANSDSNVASQKATKAYADQYKPPVGQLVIPGLLYKSDGTTKQITSTSGGFHNQVLPENGDYFIFPVYCAGTETKLDITVGKGGSRGISDLYINGVVDTSGIDGYSVATVYENMEITLTQPIIAGWNEIKFKLNGKNASAYNYIFQLAGVRLR